MSRRRLALVGLLAVLLGVAVWLGGRALRDEPSVGVRAHHAARAGDRRPPQRARPRPPTRQPAAPRLEAQVTDPEALSLLVRVQDEAGAPIAGARVSREGSAAGDERTGADGTVLLRGYSPRDEDVTIEADGFAPGGIATWTPDRAEVPIETVITLRRGAPVRGVVLGPDGAPVEGARITTRDLTPHVVSGAAGRWERIVPAGTWAFEARADGYAAAWSGPHELDGKKAIDGVVLELGRGLAIRGVVVDEDGALVGGAKVSYASMDAAGDAWADDEGRFAITGLGDGRHRIAAFDGERASEEVHVEAGDDAPELRLVVVDSMIHGAVVDEAGEPVAGVEVRALGSGAGYDDPATTDASGAFVLGPLVPGTYSLGRTYPGGAPRVFRPEVEARTGDRDVRIELASPGGIRGRVTRKGLAVPSFVVAAHDRERRDLGHTVVISNPDGAFEIAPLAPGTYRLEIAGEGFARQAVPGLHVEPGRVFDLGAVEVPGGRTVRGRVVTPDGEAVPGARVEVRPHGVRGLPFEWPAFRQALDGVRVVTSAADGTFVVEHLSEGRRRRNQLEIVAEHPTHGRSAASPVPDGDAAIELVVEGVGEIRGSVAGSRFDDHVFVSVRVDGAKTGTMAIPDAAGRFHVEGLVPATYRVEASMMGDVIQQTTVAATIDVRSGETSAVDLAFGTATLRIEAMSRCRLSLVRGDAADEDDLAARIRCDEQGRARVGGLAAGPYLLCSGPWCKAVVITESPETQTLRWE